MSPYPRDEFDNIPETSSRQGVHRAPVENNEPGILPVVLVAAAALMVGLLAFLIIPRALDSGSPQADQTHNTPQSSPRSSPRAAPTTPSPPPSPSPSHTPSAVVDKSRRVDVYNASGVTGLANRYAGRLRSAGWAVEQVGNWSGPAQSRSTVYYRDASLSATADQLGEELNLATAVDPAAANDLVVVLSADAPR